MKHIISSKLKEIEKEKDVTILFAVENGSRAWGMESANSDYDVRFVFIRKVKDYLRLNPSDEVITSTYDKEGNKVPAEGCFIDVVGFDIFKFCRMLTSSNPQVIEWLMTDIVYYGEKNRVFVDYAEKCFKPIALYFHYKSMCKNNYLKYLKSGSEVTYKKYLYAMRGLINAKYVAKFRQIPGIDFRTTLFDMYKELAIPEIVYQKLNTMINLKKQGKEKDIVQNIVEIDNLIEGFLKDDTDAPKEKQLSTVNELNMEIWRLLKCE